MGVLRKKVNRCVERRVLAARALRRRMQKCALFFFVVCTGINKQTKSTSFIFLAIFIVLEPCFFFFTGTKLQRNANPCACSKVTMSLLILVSVGHY